MRLVDLGEPTSFLDNVYLGHVNANRNENMIEEYRRMFESRISAGATQNNYLEMYLLLQADQRLKQNQEDLHSRKNYHMQSFLF